MTSVGHRPGDASLDGVLTLTLNRPDKLNSFNEEMHLSPCAPGFNAPLTTPQVRAVLLTGAGPRLLRRRRTSAIAIRARTARPVWANSRDGSTTRRSA